MSANPAKRGHFDPIHSAHAIEQVVFVVQFDTELNEPQLSEVRKAAKRFKEGDLPEQVEIQEFAFSFGSSAAPPPRPPHGLALQRKGENDIVENELRIDRSSLTFRTVLYSRWDAVWEQAYKYFESLIPLYVQHSSIRTLSLNYVDKFVWVGDVGECKPSHLLRHESKYLTPHIFETEEFWHSHTGKFIRANDSLKRLLNVNVDYLEENTADNTRRVISITTVLTDMLNQPGYKPAEIAKESSLAFIAEHMQQLHVYGKDVLGDLLINEMSKRIALIG